MGDGILKLSVIINYMKHWLILFPTLLVLNLFAKGQKVPCNDDRLKAVYYSCKSNPNEIAYKHLYFYNRFEQLDRVEKYKNHRLHTIEKNIYDSNNVLIKKLILFPDSIQNICGDAPIDLCYSKLKNRIYEYDSLSGSCYWIFDESVPTENQYDSLFIERKLFAILSEKDTIKTFVYDPKGNLAEERNYCNNRASCIIKYQYKKHTTLEYTYYSIDSEKPSLITKIEYDTDKRTIRKTRTYIFNYLKKQPSNNNIVENFTYMDNRLVEYEIYDNCVDPCFNSYCCGRYKKYFVYVD